ncbi:MAG: hypothetical protein K0Q87_2602 [Neobacillus sp.]|nr:hypothetical protein [Neobacillus sp.]
MRASFLCFFENNTSKMLWKFNIEICHKNRKCRKNDVEKQ